MVAKTIHGKQSYDRLTLNDPALNATIGSRISAIRTAKGLTQKELGAQVGMPSSRLSKAENGDNPIPVSALVRIAKALETDLNWICGLK